MDNCCRVAALTVALAAACHIGAAAAPPVTLTATQLDNGLKLRVRAYPAASTVGAALAVRVTLLDEPPGWEGIRQLLRMCLVDRAEISLAQAAVAVDGQVQHDFVMLHARCIPSVWRRAVGALLDTAFHVHFDSSLVRTEQAVMRKMETEAAAAPAIVASRAGMAALYPAVERCGKPVAAWRPAATGFLQRFYSRFFRPNRAILTVSGPVQADAVARFVREATADLLPAATSQPVGAPAATARVGRHKLTVAGEGAAVWIGARMPSPREQTYPAAVVAAALLGGGMGSRAFRRLRDDLSLVYTVAAQAVASDRCPYAFVICTCRPEDADQVADELDAIVDDLVENGPRPEELARARDFSAAEAAQLAMRNLQAAAFVSAVAIMADGLPWSRGPCRFAEALSSVSAADVRALARNWWARRTTIEVIGR